MEIRRVKNRSLNEEVKEALYRYIKSMDIQKNNKLPREEALAEMLGVSRITIRRSLTELSHEGVIFRKHGIGTFVNADALQIKITFNPAQEFEKLIRNSGYKAEVELVNIEIKLAGYNGSNKLEIDPEDEVVIVEKVFYADGNPAIYCIDRFPRKLIEGDISPNDIKLSIFEFLKAKAGKIVTRDIVEISTAMVTEDDKLAAYMNSVKPKAFLVFESVNFDQDNNPVFYDTEYYDTDLIRFSSCRQKDIY